MVSGPLPAARQGSSEPTVRSETAVEGERHPHGQVLVDLTDEHIMSITVDRVEKKNAITPKMWRELSEVLTHLDDEPSLWVGVLGFAGRDATGGLDLSLFYDDANSSLAPGRVANPSLVDPFGIGRRLTKPLIVAVQGLTYTAGIELALAGDIIVAASDARFCQLEPRRGLVPLGGGTVRYVQRSGWGNAMYHLLRADQFDAHEAWRIGLIQEIVEPGAQFDRAMELARELTMCAPLALVHAIANARKSLDEGPVAALAALSDVALEIEGTEDFQEGLTSFAERRVAHFRGR